MQFNLIILFKLKFLNLKFLICFIMYFRKFYVLLIMKYKYRFNLIIKYLFLWYSLINLLFINLLYYFLHNINFFVLKFDNFLKYFCFILLNFKFLHLILKFLNFLLEYYPKIVNIFYYDWLFNLRYLRNRFIEKRL